MKKTLKLVGIFAGILLIAVVGGLSGYFVIARNRTFYIYDVRLVTPVEGANTYIYTNTENAYTSIKNQKVYMTSEEENFIPVAAFVSSSDNVKNIQVVSSDPSVAKVVYQSGRCYVNYLKAGTAIISTSYGGVSDSFVVEVYDQVAEDFSVYDYEYYGDYASYFPNKIVGYSDSISYAYDYKAFSAAGDEASSETLNNDLLRIDTSRLNKDVFEDVHIDGKNKKLVVTCKSNIASNVDEQIVIQSFTYSDDGEVKIENNYVVNVHIVTYTPEFLQIVMARTPDFEDGYVFMNTDVISVSDLTEENILNNPDILDEYLSYKKAENNLVEHDEHEVYQTLFSEKVSKIYLKFRKVYTNGDMVYLNPLETSDMYQITCSDESKLKIAPTKDFYVLTIDETYFETNSSFNINLTLNVASQKHTFDLSHEFKFEFAELSKDNVELFYDFDETTGVYTYSYWDVRTRFDNEVYDTNGNVIGFLGF